MTKEDGKKVFTFLIPYKLKQSKPIQTFLKTFRKAALR
jgi:hypothetical protein